MKELSVIFKALADETRLRVLKLLSDGELCVCEIAAALELEQPRLSFHLSVLKKAGFIVNRRQQRWILYRLNDQDLLKRFLLLAVTERAVNEQTRLDRERLNAFPGRKTADKKLQKKMAKKNGS